MSNAHVAFSDLRTAAYCPRKCYYRRRERADGETDVEPPAEVREIRALAHRYGELRTATDDALETEPIAVAPGTYRETLERSRERLARWDGLCDPAATDVLATGRDCRGIVHKVLEDPPAPTLLSSGRPPERGVWTPQSVHAVAAAKALAWERQRPVETAYLEYPAYGVIRRLELTTRRKARYRRALRTVRSLDGPPPRIDNRSKCEACEYAAECGVRTRTLRSLLGFG